MLETEAGHASTLLEPFAHMPESQGDAREAAARLALLDGSLAPVGGRLELAALGGDQGAEPWVVLATAPGASRREPGAASSNRSRSARSFHPARHPYIHSVHSLVALAALLLATEWILRRNLLAPLRALTHQVGLIRDGRGWALRPPRTDEELRDLAEALRGLGPALERPVREWR